MDNVSPVFILWSGMVFSAGGSVSLGKMKRSLYMPYYIKPLISI